MRITLLPILVILIISSCKSGKEKTLTSFEVYCEMVAHEAKPIALSQPMEAASLDEYWEEFNVLADKYGVELYREREFPITALFPTAVTEGKEVVIIYRNSGLIQYRQFKKDLRNLDKRQAARKLGRLLGYTPQGTNRLLMENTDFRTLSSFGVRRQVTHLYYDDVFLARHFYSKILGLSSENDSTFMIGKDVAIQLHAFNQDHPKGQARSTAIALLTDQLPEWYAYVQQKDVPIKYTYKPREGGPHDGFVAIDPGGYLLEFEQFKQHPENEVFMARLKQAPRMVTSLDSLHFYGSITWTYHNDLLKMQQFYEEVLGYRMVADQGWTKIYQTSPTGFIGLVDERRGMMDYSDEKAVEVEWQVLDAAGAIDYFRSIDQWVQRQGLSGPEKYVYLIR